MKMPHHRSPCRPVLVALSIWLGASATQAEEKLNDTQLKQIQEVVEKTVNPPVSATQAAIKRLDAQIKIGQPTQEKGITPFDDAAYLSQQIFGTTNLGIPAFFLPKPNFNKQIMDYFPAEQMRSAGLLDSDGNAVLDNDKLLSPRHVLELLAFEMRVPPAGVDKLKVAATNEAQNLILEASVVGKKGPEDLLSGTITNAYKGYTTKELTSAIHKELNNPDWLSDNTRFGSLLGYIDDADAITAQVALRIYPSHHRHIPGRVIDLKNLTRRLSVVLGIGPTLVQDTGDKQDVGMAYTAGFGVDLTHEVSLFGGYSYYTYTDTGTEKQETDTAFTVGIALNAELFQNFLKASGN